MVECFEKILTQIAILNQNRFWTRMIFYYILLGFFVNALVRRRIWPNVGWPHVSGTELL